MKKTLAVVLSLLVAFSMFAVSVAAEGETTDSTASVTVKFVYATAKEAEVEFSKTVTVGTPIDAEIIPAIEKTFRAEKEDGKTYDYTFKGWMSNVDGELYYDSEMPVAEGEDGAVIVYTAQYSEKEYEEPQSFWNLVESIFERINRIFEYFAAIFNW